MHGEENEVNTKRQSTKRGVMATDANKSVKKDLIGRGRHELFITLRRPVCQVLVGMEGRRVRMGMRVGVWQSMSAQGAPFQVHFQRPQALGQERLFDVKSGVGHEGRIQFADLPQTAFQTAHVKGRSGTAQAGADLDAQTELVDTCPMRMSPKVTLAAHSMTKGWSSVCMYNVSVCRCEPD